MSEPTVKVSGGNPLSTLLAFVLLMLLLWALLEEADYRAHCTTYPSAWICLPVYGGAPPVVEGPR